MRDAIDAPCAIAANGAGIKKLIGLRADRAEIVYDLCREFLIGLGH